MFIRSCHYCENIAQAGKKELLKGLIKWKTKQRDSKWIKVTWLVCPLHINVIYIINNLGEKHIQLSVHWSPLA